MPYLAGVGPNATQASNSRLSSVGPGVPRHVVRLDNTLRRGVREGACAADAAPPHQEQAASDLVQPQALASASGNNKQPPGPAAQQAGPRSPQSLSRAKLARTAPQGKKGGDRADKAAAAAAPGHASPRLNTRANDHRLGRPSGQKPPPAAVTAPTAAAAAATAAATAASAAAGTGTANRPGEAPEEESEVPGGAAAPLLHLRPPLPDKPPEYLLNSRLASAADPEQLLHMVAEQASALTAVNAATAFHRLGKLAVFSDVPPRARRALLADERCRLLSDVLLRRHATDWTPRIASNLVWAQSKLGGPTAGIGGGGGDEQQRRLFDAAFAYMAGHGSEYSTRQLVTQLVAAGGAGHRPDWLQAQLLELLPAERMKELDLSLLSRLAWVLSRLDLGGDRVLVSRLVAATLHHMGDREQLESASARVVCSLAWGLSRLESYEPRVFDGVARFTVERCHELNPTDLCNVAHALTRSISAQLQDTDASGTDERGVRALLLQRVLADSPDRVAALRAIARCARRLRGKLSVRGVTALACAFATVQWRDGALFEMLAGRAIELSRQLDAQAVASLAWAFAQARYRHPELYDVLAARGMGLLSLEQQHERQPRQLRQQQEGSTAGSSSSSSGRDTTVASSSGTAVAGSSGGGGIRRIGQGGGSSGSGAGAGPAGGRDRDRTRSGGNGSGNGGGGSPLVFHEQSVAMAVSGMAQLGAPHSAACLRLMEALADRAEELVDEFSPQALANVAYGLVVAGCIKGRLLGRLRLRAADLSGRMAPKELVQMHMVEIALRLEAPMGVSTADSLSKDYDSAAYLGALQGLGAIRSDAASSWARHASESASGRRPSRFQMEVAAAVGRLGLGTEVEYEGLDLAAVDMALLDQRVVIEADGPTHFASNDRTPMGSTLFKRRLLRTMGWQVVSVPFFDWALLEGNADKQEEYMRNALAEVGVELPNTGGSSSSSGSSVCNSEEDGDRVSEEEDAAAAAAAADQDAVAGSTVARAAAEPAQVATPSSSSPSAATTANGAGPSSSGSGEGHQQDFAAAAAAAAVGDGGATSSTSQATSSTTERLDRLDAVRFRQGALSGKQLVLARALRKVAATGGDGGGGDGVDDNTGWRGVDAANGGGVDCGGSGDGVSGGGDGTGGKTEEGGSPAAAAGGDAPR